ncbi:MAG: hypothetical protein LUD12_03710 [Lachnospiraceae bacterium]|nr:hypothetical protein [Lachnospiraceae bacterium]
MCSYRKMHICRIWSAALIALVCMAVLSFSALAEDAVTAVIPVSVESDDSKESYWFQLTALNGAPMPERDTLVITGAGSAEFVIEYSRVGVYRYTITQEIPETGSGNYDDTVYYVIVTVQDTENGFAATVIAHRGNTEGDKCEIIFHQTSESETEKTEESEDPSETEETDVPEEPSEAEPPEETKLPAEASTEEAAKPTLPSGYMQSEPLETETDFLDITTESDYWEKYPETSATETGTSDGTAESADSASPQTGDTTPVGFWLIVMLTGFCVLIRNSLHFHN